MTDIQTLTEKIIAFRDERDWQQFHNPKDVAVSLVLEAAEVMEHFQWKSNEEIERFNDTKKAEIGEESADTLYWVVLLAHDMGIDLMEASARKMEKNALKYPVEKAKGKHNKYNDL